MPWGLKRFYGGGDLHFITGSCYRRQAFLRSAKRRDLFLAALERIRERYSFVVVGYVVMPEHFHLLLSEPEKGNPSSVGDVGHLPLDKSRRRHPDRSRFSGGGRDLARIVTAAHRPN
jgi:putative transposase